jgi:hypothetical protein
MDVIAPVEPGDDKASSVNPSSVNLNGKPARAEWREPLRCDNIGT